MEKKSLHTEIKEYLCKTIRHAFTAENENSEHALDMEQMDSILNKVCNNLPPEFNLAAWLVKNHWAYVSKGELYPGNWARSMGFMNGMNFTPAGQIRLLMIFR